MRGVASFGMMCSAKELGLAEESDGLMELAADAMRSGQSIRDHLDLDDHLITLKLTPNRSDCLSLHGIAREVAALTGASLQPMPDVSFKQTSDRSCKVKVTASAACPRYTGRVIARRERKGCDAGMDGAAPGTLRPAQHQRAGGRDQLCDAGTGATAARIRSGQIAWRHRSALRTRRGKPETAERAESHVAKRHAGDRR